MTPGARDERLVLRSTLSFAALPGIVAYIVPLVVLRPVARGPRPSGLCVASLGTIILLWCVHAFYRRGRGTLAPWDPPAALVVSGLYRYSRNPMYVGVLLVLAGWALAWGSWPLTVYLAFVAIAFHMRVVLAEEPWLAATFGEQWQVYRKSVPRWLGPRSG